MPPEPDQPVARVIRLPRRRLQPSTDPGRAALPVVVVLNSEEHAWAEGVVSSPTMQGLDCSVADVLRLGLEELRRSYASRPRLERALRAHVWTR